MANERNSSCNEKQDLAVQYTYSSNYFRFNLECKFFFHTIQAILDPLSQMHQSHDADLLPSVAFAFNQWLAIPEDILHRIIEILKLFRDGSKL